MCGQPTPSPGGRPWPGQEASSELFSPEVLAVHAVLRDWLVAIEDGKAEYRQPDPKGRTWTEAQLEAFLREMDEYIALPAQLNWANTNRKPGTPAFDAGPDYRRLEYAQRLAMAQELAAAMG